jgi:hypothetical protein
MKKDKQLPSGSEILYKGSFGEQCNEMILQTASLVAVKDKVANAVEYLDNPKDEKKRKDIS